MFLIFFIIFVWFILIQHSQFLVYFMKYLHVVFALHRKHVPIESLLAGLGE